MLSQLTGPLPIFRISTTPTLLISSSMVTIAGSWDLIQRQKSIRIWRLLKNLLSRRLSLEHPWRWRPKFRKLLGWVRCESCLSWLNRSWWHLRSYMVSGVQSPTKGGWDHVWHASCSHVIQCCNGRLYRWVAIACHWSRDRLRLRVR